MPDGHKHDELKDQIELNRQLLEQNNKLLSKLYRNSLIAFWFRLFSYALVIGLPFILYFYVLEPYFSAVGSSYENFIDGLNELPGLRGIDKLFIPDGASSDINGSD